VENSLPEIQDWLHQELFERHLRLHRNALRPLKEVDVVQLGDIPETDEMFVKENFLEGVLASQRNVGIRYRLPYPRGYIVDHDIVVGMLLLGTSVKYSPKVDKKTKTIIQRICGLCK